MSKPIVFGTPLSTFVRTTRMVLMEKGVDYEHVDVGVLDGECHSPEHLARNPFGKVPVFEHDGLTLYETNAIVRYIDQVFEGSGLSPSDAKARARMNQIMSIHDSFGYSSIVLDVVAYYFFADFVGGQNEDRLVKGKQLASICLSEYERLMGESPYLAGYAVGLADFYIVPTYHYLSLTPAAEELLGPRELLAEWWGRMSERESVRATEPQFD